jgi:hypothetical protein
MAKVESNILADFRTARNKEPNGIAVDDQPVNPFFIDETNGNYYLASTSPAVSSGESLPSDVADAINSGLATPVVSAGTAIDRGAIAWPGSGH